MNSTGYLSYISDMLAKHEAVVIPGFGGFITKYKSARIDSAAGHIYPPAKYIAFNEQLDIHDNTFARYLDEETSAHYSPRLFDLFVTQLKSDLASNQVIVIPKLGRLYQDYEGQTHFMPDLENLNNDVFGLPKLNYSKGEWNRSPVIEVAKNIQGKGLKTALSSAATVLLLFAMVWGVSSLTGSEGGHEMGLGPSTAPTEVPAVADDKDEKEEVAEIESKEIEVKEIPAEVAVPITSQKAIIIVGAFGSDSNAVKMINKIKDLGHSAYRDQPGKLHRVGVEIDYNSTEELDSMLSSVQKSITSKAWILN